MAVDGVPLFIGGGEAEHAAETLRTHNFFTFRGQEGWLTSTAGQVSALATPGSGVQVSPGPFLVNSRFPNGAQQSYMGRAITSTTVPTTNVLPGAGRSDLVVMNIEDPYPSDGVTWPYPGSEGSSARRLGPYNYFRVIEGVPASTYRLYDLPTNRAERNWTAIPCARIDRPANTSVITADMIKPLNVVINPWSGIQLPQEILDNLNQLNSAVSDIGSIIEGEINQNIAVPGDFIYQKDGVATTLNPGAVNTTTAWTTFPSNSQATVLIPPWATHADIFFMMAGVIQEKPSGQPDANVFGDMVIKIGNSYLPYSQFQTEIDGGIARFNPVNPIRWTIGTGFRGNVLPLVTQLRLARQSTFSGRLRADTQTHVYIQMRFREAH